MDSWRLTYWIGLGLSGLCFLACFFGAPETNMKIVIARRAKKLRDDKGEEIYAADEKQPFDLHQLFTKILLRPTSMLFTEPIVSFTCLYIGFLYAIFFIFLQSFPIIFTGTYSTPLRVSILLRAMPVKQLHHADTRNHHRHLRLQYR